MTLLQEIAKGENIARGSIKDGKSSKQKKAESYMLKGCDIKVLDEKTFYEIVEME